MLKAAADNKGKGHGCARRIDVFKDAKLVARGGTSGGEAKVDIINKINKGEK